MNIELIKRFAVTIHTKDELLLLKRWLLDMNRFSGLTAIKRRDELVAFISQRQLMPVEHNQGEVQAIVNLMPEEFDSFAAWVKNKSKETEASPDYHHDVLFSAIRAILFTR